MTGRRVEYLIERAAGDLARARYAIALTGAGISTESGVADFRGPKGIWTRDPAAERRAYQAYGRFLANPKEYWEERLTEHALLGDLSRAVPNAGHYALAELEAMGVLKCLITQNVDNLHNLAGSHNVLEYHGNVAKLRCAACNTRYLPEEYDLRRMLREGTLPPRCRKCGSAVKPDVVHFQEAIPSDVAQESITEAESCDLMLICGTSAVVYPFAQLPRIAHQRAEVTIIEVNAEPTPLTEEGVSDYLIQGMTGEVLPRIVNEVRKLRP